MAADDDVAPMARRQHGLVKRAQAQSVGFSRQMIRTRLNTGRWAELHPGVFLVNGAPITWRTKVMAATLATNGVASHRTAAALLEVTGFRPGPVELIVPRSAPPYDIGAIVHRSTDFGWFDPRIIDGIPTTPPDRLVVDLGAVVPFTRYGRAVDDLLLRREFTWESGLHLLMRYGRKGRNGVGPFRRLVEARIGESIPESALELVFQRLLREAGVPLPTPQVEVFDEHGFIGRVDFAYGDRRVAIELNGARWHLNAVSFEKDHRRVVRLQQAGWQVLSFTWKMVVDTPDVVLAAVRAALRQTAPDIGV